MNDLKLNKGQTVFSINLGECRVVKVKKDDDYPYVVEGFNEVYSECYTKTGRMYKSDIHPSLFASPESCKEYFNNLTDDNDITEVSLPLSKECAHAKTA